MALLCNKWHVKRHYAALYGGRMGKEWLKFFFVPGGYDSKKPEKMELGSNFNDSEIKVLHGIIEVMRLEQDRLKRRLAKYE